MAIKGDFRRVEDLADRLRTMAKQGVPHAMRNAVNRSAFAARKVWKREIEGSMTLRNTYTTRSLRVVPARGVDPRNLMAVLGSESSYLGERERGATKATRIPTAVAAGQSPGAKRTKVVRAPNKLGSIKLANRPHHGGRRQRNAAAIRISKAKGAKFVYLEGQQHSGLYKLQGGKRRTIVKMVWDLSKRKVTVKPMPTLARTLAVMQSKMLPIHEGALIQQLKRHKLY